MVRDTVENCLFAKKVSGGGGYFGIEGVILRGGGVILGRVVIFGRDRLFF